MAMKEGARLQAAAGIGSFLVACSRKLEGETCCCTISTVGAHFEQMHREKRALALWLFDQ